MKKVLYPLLLLFSLFGYGPAEPLSDPLLDQLQGRWKLTGEMLGKPLNQVVEVKWVLDHQFLQFSFSSPPDAKVPYQGEMWIGRDAQGYVAHLLDQFGAEPSRTLGFGIPGEQLQLLFSYPTADFRQTYERRGDSWRIVIESRQGSDQPWTEWAVKTMVPIEE